MARDSSPDRAVSISVNHVLSVAITTLLLVGLLTAFGGFADRQIKQSGEAELRVIGERIAAEIQVADRIARAGGQVSIVVNQPAKVSTGAYSVELLHGSACDTSRFTADDCLLLETSTRPVSVKIPIANVSTITITPRGAGTFVITASAPGPTGSVDTDIQTDVGIDVGVGRQVRAPTGGSEEYDLSNRPPLAKFVYAPGAPTTDSIIRFNATGIDTDGNITKYEWDLNGDGTVDKTGEAFDYSYLNPGIYNVTLTVTDNNGATDSTTTKVVVAGLVYNDDAETEDFDGNDVEGGVEFSVTSEARDITITSVSLHPRDDAITELDEDLAGDTEGAKELFFEPDSGAERWVDGTVKFTEGGRIIDLSVEGNGVVELDANEDMEIYLSEFHRSGGVEQPMFGKRVNVSVRYYVTVGGERRYFVSKFTLFGSAPEPPQPSFSVSCSGKTCTFDGSGSSDPDGSIASFNWSFGDGTRGSGPVVTRTYAANGSYEVTLTITDDDGITTSLTKTVSIGRVPLDVQVNFQPAAALVPDGYVVDSGEVYGPRGNGYTYGWNASADETRDRNVYSNTYQEYDTLTHMDDAKYGADRVWEFAVPVDGKYRVYIVMGDPLYSDQTNRINIEGEVIDDPDPYPAYWGDNLDRYVTVAEVTDGNLTIQPASGSENAKINFVHIEEVDARPWDEQGGQVVFEAEHFQEVQQGTGSLAGTSFIPIEDGAASGEALYVTPDRGDNAGDSTIGQRLDFRIDFDTTGTYYVWVRMRCPTGGDDSIHVGLDGTPRSYGANGLTQGCTGAGGYTWVYRAAGRPVTLNVSTTGIHTFNIWVREDGVRVDKVVLTKRPPSAWTPSDQGPEESDRA